MRAYHDDALSQPGGDSRIFSCNHGHTSVMTEEMCEHMTVGPLTFQSLGSPTHAPVNGPIRSISLDRASYDTRYHPSLREDINNQQGSHGHQIRCKGHSVVGIVLPLEHILRKWQSP